MGFEVTHVNQFVLTNADQKFSKVKSGPKKNGKYDKKKAKNFYELKDPDGNTKAIGYDGANATDDDGDGVGPAFKGDPHQADTSASWDDGSGSVNFRDTDAFVLPKNLVKPGGPFYGMKLGDYGKVTNLQTGETRYGVYADNGPDNEVGEISQHLSDNIHGNGSPTMTDANQFRYEMYPGSGQRDKHGRIKKQTNDEIQKNGKAAADAASVKGGYIIKRNGNNSILVGQKIQPVVAADPWSFHVGDCKLKTGSDSVSAYGFPMCRVGDDCSCGKQVISGDTSVFAYGNPTQYFQVPKADLPPGWKAPKLTPGWDNDQTIPAWAQPAMGPTSSLPSTQSVGGSHFPAQ